MLHQESQKVSELKYRLQSFMDRHVYPNEDRFYKEAEELGPWKVFPVVEELKPKAREAGLWNLFLPESEHGAGLTNLEYAPLCEVMGRSAGYSGVRFLRRARPGFRSRVRECPGARQQHAARRGPRL